MPTHITILDNADPRDIYAIGGAPQSVFPISYDFFDAITDIKVVKTVAGVDTILAQGTDWTAVGDTTYAGGFHGGTLTLIVPVSNCQITSYRDAPFVRTDDFPTTGPFNMVSLNTTLDRFVTLLQQLRATLSRTPSLPVTIAAALLGIKFPLPVAGKAVGWNATADGLANLDFAGAGLITIPVPIAQGGHAAVDAPTGLKNLGIAGAMIQQVLTLG